MRRLAALLATLALVGVAGFGNALVGVTGNFYPYPEEPYSLFRPGFAVGYDADSVMALFSAVSATEQDGQYLVPLTLSVLPAWRLAGGVRGFAGVTGMVSYSEEDSGFGLEVGPSWGVRLGLDWELGIGAGWLHVNAAWLLPQKLQLGFLYEFGPIGSE